METHLIRTGLSRHNRTQAIPRNRRVIRVEDTREENSAARRLSKTVKQGRSGCSGLLFFAQTKDLRFA